MGSTNFLVNLYSTIFDEVSVESTRFYDHSLTFSISSLQKISNISLSLSHHTLDQFLYNYTVSKTTRERILASICQKIHSTPTAYMSIPNNKRLVPIVKWALCNLIESAKRKDKKLVPIYKNLLQEIKKQSKL